MTNSENNIFIFKVAFKLSYCKIALIEFMTLSQMNKYLTYLNPDKFKRKRFDRTLILNTRFDLKRLEIRELLYCKVEREDKVFFYFNIQGVPINMEIK